MGEAPGWEAIDAALAGIYADARPHHWGTAIRWALGGPDPLDGVSAYERTEPAPHWHYVTYGLTQLYPDDSEMTEYSGWGFELTFRLARDAGDTEPPVWAVSLLQNLARYVFNSRNWFESGHHMNIGGPIASDRPDTAIRAIAFAEDPELGSIDTPHGRVQFLQVVGLTPDEYEAVQLWRTTEFLEAVAPSLPLLLTDVDRHSLLDDPSIAARVQAGVDEEGSSTGTLMVDGARWNMSGDVAVVILGALQAPFIARLLRARLSFGRDFVVVAGESVIRFHPAETLEISVDDRTLEVGVPPAVIDPLVRACASGPGRVTVADGLAIEVVPTVVRDAYGEPTGEVVG